MTIIRSSTLYLCYYRIWCVIPWLLVVGGQVQGSRLCVRDEGSYTSVMSSSWWSSYMCPKYVEQIISAINHLVASSWFSSLRIYSDARTNIHKIYWDYIASAKFKWTTSEYLGNDTDAKMEVLAESPVPLPLHTGAQFLDTSSLWRLNFVGWLLTFLSPHCGTCTTSSFRRIKFWDGS